MQRRDLGELLLLALLWGAAYLFMRSAVPAFGPGPLIALRMAIAAAVLLPLLVWRGSHVPPPMTRRLPGSGWCLTTRTRHSH